MKNSKAPKRLSSNIQKQESAQSSRKSGTTTNSNAPTKNQICDICAQDVPGPEREKIFAFGNCDHHVCYVCSARLIAVCEQYECPICRKKLDSVSMIYIEHAQQV